MSHTPGPWTYERSFREFDGDVHFTIRTVEKLPEHPHSARYIAWLTGCLREYVPPSGRPKGTFCDACRRWRYDGREVPVEVRDDPQTEADACLMAAAPLLFDALKACAEQLAQCLGPDTEAGKRAQFALSVATQPDKEGE